LFVCLLVFFLKRTEPIKNYQTMSSYLNCLSKFFLSNEQRKF